jgi:hypothetical protein
MRSVKSRRVKKRKEEWLGLERRKLNGARVEWWEE